MIKGQSCPTLHVPDFKIPLLPHQAFTANWIEGNTKSLIIQAPTASGKTLAALSAVLRLSTMNRKSFATFIYPTNELIKNQVTSMTKGLKELKFRPAVFSSSSSSVHVHDKSDYNVAIIEGTGEVLHTLAFSSSSRRTRNTKIRSFGNILASLLAHTAKINILATNPDSLYLVASARYGSSPSILTEIADADIFVIDEFHAYHGVSLANLMYTLKMIDSLGRENKRFLFLSATPPTNLLDTIENMFGRVISIRLSDLFSTDQRKAKGLNYEETVKPRIISHDIRLSLLPLASLENFASLGDIISREVKQVNTRDNVTVPCVLILNSVLDAVSISRILQDRGLQVNQIHGLVPKKLRKIFGDVVVGTSAIELGIDFQAHSVIFEGTDSASFLQRFGRAGRHFKGNAIGFVPARILTSQIGNAFERENFEGYISNVLTNNENYAGFIQSSNGMDLLSAIILSVYQSLDKIEEKMDLINEAKNTILHIGRSVQQSTGATNVELGSRMYKRMVKNIASRPSLRGSSNSVIVFLRQPYNAAINIDIIDAYKKLEGLEELDNNSVSNLIDNNLIDNETKALLIYGLHSRIPLMQSTGILEVKNQVELAANPNSYGVAIAGDNNPISLIVNGQPVTRSQHIFTDIPYCISSFYPDWRFNPIRIYETTSNYGIIGVSSLVYEWFQHRNS